MKNCSFILIGFLFLLISCSNAAALTIDVLAQNPRTVVKLDEGTYLVTPKTGNFSAWSAWSSGARWLNDYAIEDANKNELAVSQDGVQYDSMQTAFNAAESVFFSINTQKYVHFILRDLPYSDNRGGMSFDVTLYQAAAVPVPGTLLLLSLGFLGIAGISRKDH